MDLLPARAVSVLLEVNADPKGSKPESFLLAFMQSDRADTTNLCMAFAAMAKETGVVTWEALEMAASALQHGAEKYSEWDWMSGAKWSRYIAAALRHIKGIRIGAPDDSDSGLPHASHFLACVLILLTYVLTNIGDDDRHRSKAA